MKAKRPGTGYADVRSVAGRIDQAKSKYEDYRVNSSIPRNPDGFLPKIQKISPRKPPKICSFIIFLTIYTLFSFWLLLTLYNEILELKAKSKSSKETQLRRYQIFCTRIMQVDRPHYKPGRSNSAIPQRSKTTTCFLILITLHYEFSTWNSLEFVLQEWFFYEQQFSTYFPCILVWFIIFYSFKYFRKICLLSLCISPYLLHTCYCHVTKVHRLQ